MPGPSFLGDAPEHRFQPDLGDEAALGRTQMLHALVEVAEEERHVLGGQALDRDDRAVLPELLLRGGVDFLLDPGASKDLHRAVSMVADPGTVSGQDLTRTSRGTGPNACLSR